MVEYTFDEATALLEKNMASSEKQLETLDEDLAWVKDQITTGEVNIRRVHNYGVKYRQSQKK